MNKGVGYRLSLLTKDAGITNYVLAKETGISAATISRIIKKDQKPQSATLKKLCNYFKVREKWFLTGEGPKDRSTDIEPSEKYLKAISTDEEAFKKLADQVARIVLDGLKEPLERATKYQEAIILEQAKQATRIEMIHLSMDETKDELVSEIKNIKQ